MTFAYQPSAAGISWISLCSALDSQAQRQKDLLNLYKSDIAVAIQNTEGASKASFTELYDQGEGQFENGILGLGGVALGFVAAVGSYGMEMKNINAANKEGNTTSNKIGIGMKEDDIELQDISPSPTGSAQVAVDPSATTSTSGAAATTPAKTTQPNPKQDEYLRTAQRWQQQGSNFTSFANQIGTSTGGVLSAKYTMQAAEAKSEEVLAQGIAQVMNTQGQMITSGVDGTNAQMNNTESVISTIIQVSAARA